MEYEDLMFILSQDNIILQLTDGRFARLVHLFDEEQEIKDRIIFKSGEIRDFSEIKLNDIHSIYKTEEGFTSTCDKNKLYEIKM